MVKSKKHVEFAICVANEGYDDLQVWKIYRVLREPKALEVGCIRVVDDSGEDHLYPTDRFVAVDFPKDIRARLPKWQPSNGPNKALRAPTKNRRRLSA